MGKRRRLVSRYDAADELVQKITGRPIAEHARLLWDTFLEPELRRIVQRRSAGDPRYALLELSEGCSNQVLKAAWRAKCRQAHPDTGGSDEAFKQFYAAYESICRERGIKP